MGEFRLILADCPWAYNSRRGTRRDNPAKKCCLGIGLEHKYSTGTMSTNNLCNLGSLISEIATNDAYLFMWATCPRLTDAILVMESWGFEYITVVFNWIKTNSKSGSYFAGPGAYSLSNMEPVLLGRKKNKPCWHSNTKGCYKPYQIIAEPHPRNELGKIIHSRKPDKIHEELETWLDPYLDGYSKLELFATKPREGWTCLGHAISGKKIDQELQELIVSSRISSNII